MSDTGVQVGFINEVEELTRDSFAWITPPCPAENKKLTLQVSWNKQNWQSIVPVGRNFTFEYIDAPEVSSITPHFGPVKSPNGETVVLSGKNFICPENDCSKVTVRFGSDEVKIYVPGIVTDETHITCVVPKYTKPDVLEVEISLDGEDFTHNRQTYGFFDAYLLDVQPRLLSKNGGTSIKLSGFGFVNTGSEELKAKFSTNDQGELTCGTSPCITDAYFESKNVMRAKSVPQGQLYYSNHTNIGEDGFTIEVAVYNRTFTHNNI
jgi:hypothetical protein